MGMSLSVRALTSHFFFNSRLRLPQQMVAAGGCALRACRAIGKESMSPSAGMLLVNEIRPRIQAAVGRGCVRPYGCEDVKELVADGVAIAARMLDSAEAAGKKVTPGNVAFFALQTLKSGRRSNRAGRQDAMCPAAALDGHVAITSMDEPRGVTDDDPDGETTLHDLLASSGEDGSTEAARRIDWNSAMQTMDDRTRAVLRGTAEGVGTGELAARYHVSAPRVCQVREAAGAKITAAWGGNPVADASREAGWAKHVRTYAQRRACRAERAARQAV